MYGLANLIETFYTDLKYSKTLLKEWSTKNNHSRQMWFAF